MVACCDGITTEGDLRIRIGILFMMLMKNTTSQSVEDSGTP